MMKHTNKQGTKLITEMSDRHIERTLNVLVNKSNQLIEESDSNPRFISEMSELLARMSKYYLALESRNNLSIVTKNNIEYVYKQFEQATRSIYIEK